MSLTGDVGTVSLGEVLHLLAATAKTGCLHIEGDRGRAQIRMHGGGLVAASIERLPADSPIEETMFELLRCRSGSYTFEPASDVTAAAQPSWDLNVVLRDAYELLAEWGELSAFVPSVDHHVILREQLDARAVTIDDRTWVALRTIGAGRTVAELAGLLLLGEIETLRRVRDLIELGVAVVREPSTRRSARGRQELVGVQTGR